MPLADPRQWARMCSFVAATSATETGRVNNRASDVSVRVVESGRLSARVSFTACRSWLK